MRQNKNCTGEIDGNTRIRRLLLNLELTRAHMGIIDIKFKNSVSYYIDFNEYRKKNNLQPIEKLS